MGDYFETYVERDLRQLMAVKDLTQFERFVKVVLAELDNSSICKVLATMSEFHTPVHVRGSPFLKPAISFICCIRGTQMFPNALSNHRNSISMTLDWQDFLLGLENENQVNRDPLRGNLFENMVVMEA